MNKIYYHVVTERPMKLGQQIIFDDNHHSGVYDRVYAFKDKVEEIYKNPKDYENVELEKVNILITLQDQHHYMFLKVQKKQKNGITCLLNGVDQHFQLLKQKQMVMFMQVMHVIILKILITQYLRTCK